MAAYIVRRVIIGILMLFAMSFVTFVLFFAAGDPSKAMCQKNCTPDRIADIGKVTGYSQPITTQYGEFVKGIFVGRDYPNDPDYRAALIANGHENQIIHCSAPCLGYSTIQTKTVNKILGQAAPVTISMSVVAFVAWIIVGLLFGVLTAVFKGSWLDRTVIGVNMAIYAMPTFFVGNFLLIYVSIKWHWVPFPRYVPITDNVWHWFTNLLLPSITLALFFMAAYIRMTRAFILETMTEDYIRTARAKGLPGRTVLFKHGLRAALTPLVTMAGMDFAILMAGAVITESVFTFHGLGLLAVQANAKIDLPVLIGLVLIAGTAVIVMNIVVDILYAYIDPRVRMAGGK